MDALPQGRRRRIIPSPPPAPNRQMLPSLQLGRFLAALAVVCFHANLTLALPKYYGAEALPLARAGFAGVEYFFVLSGFIIVVAHWRDLTGTPRPAAFTWKRFRRIFPSLWVVLLPLAVLVLAKPEFSPLPGVGPVDILWSFALLPPYDAYQHEPLLSVLWTLRFEMLFYALFLLFLLRRGVAIVLSAVWLLVSAASLAGEGESIHPFWIAPFPLLFAIGAGAGWLHARQVRLAWLPLLGAGGVLLAFAAAIAMRAPGGFHAAWLVLLFGVGAGLCIVGAAARDRARSGPGGSRIATFLGDASYSIYLVHFPLLSVLCKLAVRLMPGVPASVVFAGAVAASVAAGVVFHVAVERPLLRRIPARLPGR